MVCMAWVTLLGPIVDFTKSHSPINWHIIPILKTSEFMHFIIWDSPISIPEGGGDAMVIRLRAHRLILGHIRSGRQILQHRKMPFRRGLGC